MAFNGFIFASEQKYLIRVVRLIEYFSNLAIHFVALLRRKIMGFATFKTINIKEDEAESLRVNYSQRRIRSNVRVLQYRDKDTRQIVIYIPSFDLTGYGATREKAEEMIKFSIDNFFQYLISLPVRRMQGILHGLGWKHNPLKNKEYSKAYIDKDGNLNLNAANDDVEEKMLMVA